VDVSVHTLWTNLLTQAGNLWASTG
jgi:hypothetical protein